MTELKGIDVSSWDGNIDWFKVKQAGIQFAMIRVVSGTNVDKFFANNIIAATKNNIPCGVYVYSYATTPEMAKKEAELALHSISPYKITLPVVYDIEDKAQHNLTNAQRTNLIVAFCSAVQAVGYKAGVYSSLSWFNSMFDLKLIEGYEKWIAQWGVNKCSYSGQYSLWQTTDSGKVPGIQGNVDLNICYRDYTSHSKDNK